MLVLWGLIGSYDLVLSQFLPDVPLPTIAEFTNNWVPIFGWRIWAVISLALFLFATLEGTYRQQKVFQAKLSAIPGATPNAPKVATPELHFDEVNYSFGFSEDGQSLVTIEVFLNATGSMPLESAELEISGQRTVCYDWTPDVITPGVTYSMETHCINPHGLKAGRRSMRLLVFANNEWWASNWESIEYSPINS